MLGGTSLKLATVFGIRVGVNASWFLVLFLAIFWLQDLFGDRLSGDAAFVTAVAAAIGFFGSILLHELGHALAARREGMEVSGIDLFFFGGVMKMARDTTSPGQEFRVAAAGPLVTLAIVLIGGAALAAVMGEVGIGVAGDTAFELWLTFTVTMNLLLLGFNLVPAFPLDGGRIARAAAWKVTGDRGKATRLAAYLGQGFAALLIAYGIFAWIGLSDEVGGLWAIVLGYLLGSSARAAIAQSQFTDRLAGVTVADIMDAEPVTIPADLPAARAFDEYFLRYQGWPWFAVVEADGRFAGIAYREAVEAAGSVPVRDVTSGFDDRVRDDAPLEALLGSEPLRRMGALMAVDADGRLRGVVTVDQVTRALQSRLSPA